MKELPDGFEATELIEPLALGWSFEAETLDYAPVGFGSYHWVATDAAGRRVFVTVDDLDRKPALGHTRGAAFDGLDAGVRERGRPKRSRSRVRVRARADTRRRSVASDR